MNKEQSIKVSVVIPVYNTELYVGEAIKSISNQTLKDIEIIVIDDGSTDNSLDIIKEIAADDSRLHFFTQSNHGQSVARNYAIHRCQGEYIYFMDSDDILESTALEECYNRAIASNLDMVIFDAEILNKNSKLSLNINYCREGKVEEYLTYAGIDLLHLLFDRNAFTPSPCLYIVKRDFLENLQLLFHPNIIHEDQLFTLQLYLYASSIQYIPKMFFKRRVRENSTMTSSLTMRNVNSYFIIVEELLKLSERKEIFKDVIDKHIASMLDPLMYLSYKLPLNDRISIALKVLKRYYKYVSNKNLLILLFKSFIKK